MCMQVCGVNLQGIQFLLAQTHLVKSSCQHTAKGTHVSLEAVFDNE